MRNLSDQEIVAIIQSGDKESFAWLIERYEGKIKRYLSRFCNNPEDIDDIAQTVFIKSYQNIKQFNLARPFSPWIYRIAHNELVNSLKKKRKDPLPFFDLDCYFPQLFGVRETEETINRHETERIVNKNLGKIDFKYREVLVLYYFEELTYQEISDVLRIPLSTVGVRLRRARKILKKTYQDNYGK